MPMLQEQKIRPLRSDREALKFIEEVTKKADEYQSKVLAEILSRNASTEYLQRCCLNGRTDRQSFKKCVPMVSYEHIQQDILHIANGDKSPILSTTPISEFLTSSGTSAGERKLMPTIPEEMDRKEQFYSLLMPLMNQYMEGLEKGKAMYFLFVKAETITPGGLPARPVLTSYYKSKQFQKKAFEQNGYTSPLEAILCTDTAQSMYVQMLCGLLQRHSVMRVGAVFASGLLRALHFLQKHWRSLAQDILTGTLNPDAVSDPALCRAVEKVLRPDAYLADLIHAECSDGEGRSWEGIIRRLWPNTRYLEVVVTGAMAQYIPALDFFSGGLPKACVMYASSECFLGVNLAPLAEPQDVSYTLIPTMAFFEFIPVRRANNNEFDDSNDNEKENEQEVQVVDLAHVQVGHEYELLVTTYAGLYRYKVGDVLRVTGFHNAAPQFKFIRRRNAMLSIDADKTDEAELQEAVTNAAKTLLRDYGTDLVEFSSYADTVSTIPGHYVLFWEVTPMPLRVPAAVMNQCCVAVEEGLNSVYRQCRASDKSIGPLEIRVVQRGTFDKIMDLSIARGSSINQYKTPRCIRSEYILQLLNQRSVASFFSPCPPRWAPRNHWHNI